MPTKAKIHITFICVAGLAMALWQTAHWDTVEIARFVAYTVMAILASCLKVRLPGIYGTMSVNFCFILIAITQLSLPETITMSCLATLVQCLWKTKSPPRLIQVLFSLGSISLAVWATHEVRWGSAGFWALAPTWLRIVASACTYFVTNTLPVATVVALTERKSISRVWKECYFWCLPYYLLGAAVAALVGRLTQLIGWPTATLVIPILYFMYRSYHLYLQRLENEKEHAEEVANLHLRTIEALAMAIEAKDFTTHSHLRRVEIFACAIGKELGLDKDALEALRAASLLHDIGKLAVPEHIISKPGKLTPVEFEKMKIHPVVGAEILDRVEFPYPVAPIVRAHHEKWNGSGYPDGLRGEAIPLGARILSAVDCLDALASDREYRRALPLDEAMKRVTAEAGTSFDPRVVKVLARRYRDLEQQVQGGPCQRQQLSHGVKVERGAAPAAGFEKSGEAPSQRSQHEGIDFLSSIAAAHQEAQMLFELSQTLGNSLSLDETLSLLGLRLKKMIPYDSIAVYVRRENRLVPEYVNGENFRLFASLEIPLGEGLSGWVARTCKPILNGNPSVEPAYLGNPDAFSTLRSALAVPLEGVNGVVGVLALYHAERDFFTKDHLRMLLAITEKVALSIENALKYRQAESCATTDALTGLPNARSLFMHLDRELARCKRENTTLSVLVCDLDGFKQVNDRFGHLEGNRVLQAVARRLGEVCREYDYVARMGGDEFVVVLPGHGPAAVAQKSLRLGVVAAEAGLEVCGSDLLSMSVGAAFYPYDGTDAEQLLAEADRRMYKAKHQAAASLPAPWNHSLQTAVVQ